MRPCRSLNGIDVQIVALLKGLKGWMVRGGCQTLGSRHSSEIGEGTCQLDGCSRVGQMGYFFQIGRCLVLGNFVKEWGVQGQPQG